MSRAGLTISWSATRNAWPAFGNVPRGLSRAPSRAPSSSTGKNASAASPALRPVPLAPCVGSPAAPFPSNASPAAPARVPAPRRRSRSSRRRSPNEPRHERTRQDRRMALCEEVPLARLQYAHPGDRHRRPPRRFARTSLGRCGGCRPRRAGQFRRFPRKGRKRRNEAKIRRREGLRPQAAMGRHHAHDKLGRSGERNHHRHRPHLRQHQLPGLGKEPRREPLAHDRCPHRLQRRRLLRSLSQILGLRRPRTHRQIGAGPHRFHKRGRRMRPNL